MYFFQKGANCQNSKSEKFSTDFFFPSRSEIVKNAERTFLHKILNRFCQFCLLLSKKKLPSRILKTLSNLHIANHDLYYWGRGEYGVFGDGSNSDQKLPQVNGFIQRIRKSDNVTFKKIKSCASQTLALASKNNKSTSNLTNF